MNNVPSLETVYLDYAPKGVRFYYLYKALAHPELGGYVQAFTFSERLMHVEEAQRTLGSGITWICDNMDNEAKRFFGSANNAEFIFDPDGKIVRMRTWSKPASLRRDLEALVGNIENPTRVSDLNMKTALPSKVAASGVVPKIKVSQKLEPVKTVPKIGLDTDPFYAKLRVEVEPQVLRTGEGQMYLGFHMDPLYHVHWNNLVEPVSYELKPPDGTKIVPTTGKGPKVDVPSDIDAREFLVAVENGKSGEPIELTVRYFACNDEAGWCKPVTQRYAIYLEKDPYGGGVMGRSFGFGRNRASRDRRGGQRDSGRRTSGESPLGGLTARIIDSDKNDTGFNATPVGKRSPEDQWADSLPDISFYAQNKSDRFIVDMADVTGGHPFKGLRSAQPHGGAHVYFDNRTNRWPKGLDQPQNYPPIYAAVDGVIARIDERFQQRTGNDRYGIDLAFAKDADGNMYRLCYSIEPMIPQPSPGFYTTFMTVELGQRVKKGDVIGYMYTPPGVESVHIHFHIKSHPKYNDYFMAPALFTPEWVKQFAEKWHGFRGRDGEKNMPPCTGYMLSAPENPFGTGAVDTL